MFQASHPSSGQEVLYPILVPEGRAHQALRRGKLWISWNVGTSPCSVPWLCFPGLHGRGAAGLESQEESPGFPSCIHPHLGARPAAKHLDLCSWQSNPVIPANQRLSRGENSGLKWDREEERRIWSWSDGLSHLYRLRLRQKESGLDGKSAAPPRSPGRAFQLVPNKHSSEGRNGAWRAPFPSPGLLCVVGSACTSFIVILPLIQHPS